MTRRFEQNVRQAFASFMAETERTVTAAIREAFAKMLMHAVDDAGAPRTEISGMDPLLPRHPPAPTSLRPPPRSTDLALLREQLIACVHGNPGSTTAELSGWLGIHDGKVRRQLMRLSAEGVLRWEERRSGLGGQWCRTFFLQQREVAQVASVIAQPHVSHSAAPSATLGESP
jgi:hypothetical protein